GLWSGRGVVCLVPSRNRIAPELLADGVDDECLNRHVGIDAVVRERPVDVVFEQEADALAPPLLAWRADGPPPLRHTLVYSGLMLTCKCRQAYDLHSANRTRAAGDEAKAGGGLRPREHRRPELRAAAARPPRVRR